MPVQAEMEVRTIEGREVKIRWKPSRHGEWLAWCYLPGPAMLFSEGVGFEARAGSAEAAREELASRVRSYLSGGAAGS